jgi:hypothetical protein
MTARTLAKPSYSENKLDFSGLNSTGVIKLDA